MSVFCRGIITGWLARRESVDRGNMAFPYYKCKGTKFFVKIQIFRELFFILPALFFHLGHFRGFVTLIVVKNTVWKECISK